MSNLKEETQKLKKIIPELQKLDEKSIKREDVARILEFLMALIPVLIRILKSR